MSLVSMTGFAFGEAVAGPHRLSGELKSYNNRYLDLAVTLPPGLADWEPEARDLLAARAARGRVELTLRLHESGETPDLAVNEALVARYAHAWTRLRRAARSRGPLRTEFLAGLPGVLSPARAVDPGRLREAAQGLTAELLAGFQRSRTLEGARLQADVGRHLAVITQGREHIAARAAGMEASFRETLLRKFRELQVEADENRLLAETALLLVKTGINEELVRLASHEAAFQELLTQSGPVGKKLDFLCQELGREINTIGSKTTFADVQQRVVTMKDALENLREQLRNVE